MLAKQIMISTPYTIYPDIIVGEAYEMLQDLGIGHFPVVDRQSEKLLGVISYTNILPYVPPVAYPPKLKYKKRLEAAKTTVAELMTKISDITTFIYENEDSTEFLSKFYRNGSPPLNLLLVLNNQKDQKLKGVISWVDLLKNWETLVDAHSLNEINKLKAIDIAVPLEEIPFLDEHNYHAGSALIRSKGTVHRHIRIIEKGQLVSLFHFHELAPYQPVGEDPELADYFYNLQVNQLVPQHSVEKRTIPFDLPIWVNKDEPSVVNTFLESVLGDDKKWQDRIAGLLLQQKDKTLSHLLNPYDVIHRLLKKKRNILILYRVDYEAAMRPDGQLQLKILRDEKQINEILDDSQIKVKKETQEVIFFFQKCETCSDLQSYLSIKDRKILTDIEIDLLDEFLLEYDI